MRMETIEQKYAELVAENESLRKSNVVLRKEYAKAIDALTAKNEEIKKLVAYCERLEFQNDQYKKVMESF